MKWIKQFCTDLIEELRIQNGYLHNITGLIAESNDLAVPASPSLKPLVEPGLYRANDEAKEKAEYNQNVKVGAARVQQIYDWSDEDAD